MIGELSHNIHRNARQTSLIEELVERVNQSTREIDYSTSQLYEAFAQVVESTEEIGLVAQQTAQSSYTINDTAQNLEELSTQLKLAFLS